MRADRLISLMMLLQANGQMTAEALATSLEISQRTIYRDIDALSGAGIPVYANGGPGGGYALLDNYRTSLTGLNNNERRALFYLTLPSPLSDLDETQSLRRAVLKLTDSLSHSPISDDVEQFRQRLHIDTANWFQSGNPIPHLKICQSAVWAEREIVITYRYADGGERDRQISPLGLVAKANRWYLVSETENGRRVFRVSRIQSVDLLDTGFTRSADFDLPEFWADWVKEYESGLPQYPVMLRVQADHPHYFPDNEKFLALWNAAEATADGSRLINYIFEQPEEAQAIIFSMGSSVEVLEPQELRQSLLLKANEIVNQYNLSYG